MVQSGPDPTDALDEKMEAMAFRNTDYELVGRRNVDARGGGVEGWRGHKNGQCEGDGDTKALPLKLTEAARDTGERKSSGRTMGEVSDVVSNILHVRLH